MYYLFGKKFQNKIEFIGSSIYDYLRIQYTYTCIIMWKSKKFSNVNNWHGTYQTNVLWHEACVIQKRMTALFIVKQNGNSQINKWSQFNIYPQSRSLNSKKKSFNSSFDQQRRTLFVYLFVLTMNSTLLLLQGLCLLKSSSQRL